MPTVTASNGCGAIPVTMAVQLPAASGGATTSVWPSHFPIGVSTVTWTATTPAGQSVTRSQTIEVLDYQVVTLDVNLAGSMPASINYSLPIRFRFDSGLVVTQPMSFAGADGAVTDIRVPVRANYGCVSAKSTTHTISTSGSLAVVGTKYVASAPIALTAGDSNDDNLVDVLDFGNFASDRGLGKTASSRSNYDHNPVVNTADFTFITLNFFKVGGECTANFAPGQPRDRVKVKDLRRAGLGHMAVADINGDGWVDTTDMALFAQGAIRTDNPELNAPAGGAEGGGW
jgi:hypothetical protein